MFIDDKREGAKMGKDQRAAQKAMVAKANEWTAKQAERLGVMYAEVLDAVKRGWLSGIIEHLPASRVGEISGPPDCSDAYGKLREQIKTAEVRPIQRKPPPPRIWKNLWLTEYTTRP